jgi:hypothetical protein
MLTLKDLRNSISRAYSAVRYRLKIPSFSHTLDQQIKTRYLDKRIPFETRYHLLIRYFLTSFGYHSRSHFTRAYYPGAFSEKSRDIDAIEGSARLLPLLAVLLHTDKQTSMPVNSNKEVEISTAIKEAITHGTDPTSKDYWGDIQDFDQRIAEAADIALSIHLSKKQVWNKLDEHAKSRILDWLNQCQNKKIVDNNWHLFKFLISLIVNKLDTKKPLLNEHYQRVKDFHVGNGWFTDGEGDKFDYYNAWAFHYTLFWINHIDSSYDPEFISTACSNFCKTYQYFFSSEGLPFFGRSACYRFAVPSPLIANYLMGDTSIPSGLVKRCFDDIWQYFIKNNSLKHGIPTQGYFKTDYRFLDNYSGPASSLWGLRSLILLSMIPVDSTFWTLDHVDYPVEIGNFTVKIPEINLVIEGNNAQNEIKAIWPARKRKGLYDIESYGFKRRVKAFLLQNCNRPENENIKNGLHSYSSKHTMFKFK